MLEVIMKRFLEVYNYWFYKYIYAPICQLHLFWNLSITVLYIVAEISPPSVSPKLRDSGDTVVTYTVLKKHYLWPKRCFCNWNRMVLEHIHVQLALTRCPHRDPIVMRSGSYAEQAFLASGYTVCLILVCGMDSCLPCESGERTTQDRC